jgi:hypothetical protein
MRPAHKTISAGRLDEFESRLIFNFRSRSSLKEHPNLVPSTATVSPKPVPFVSFFYSQKREKVN